MLVSGVQQNDSVIHTYIYILFHYSLLQDIKYSSLCCTVRLHFYLFYMKKEFIGPGLRRRPVRADHAWPPFQRTLNSVFAAATANSLQSCPTLCDPIDGSPAGSPVPGILKARTLEWVAISFSNA